MLQCGGMLRLRPYQQELLRRVRDALDDDNTVRVMLQLPTGGGKTVIAGALLADWLTRGRLKRRKAVWLTHRKELAQQTRRMLTFAGVAAIINENWTSGEDAPYMLGGAVILMAQTVGRRNVRRQVWGRYNGNDLLIIDEAHHATADGWKRAMEQWPGPVVGMTATPWRLSEQEGFNHLFGELLCGPQVAELQELGSLCPAQVMMPPRERRIAGGAVDRTGDYTESGIAQANRDRPDIMTAGALEFWRKHCVGRQTIAYAVSTQHAHNLAAVFKDGGIPAAVILGNTPPAERDAAIAGFRDSSIRVMVNVLVATEGFDLPDASGIIIARPTMSLALYLQMAGRGLRPKPDGGNCVILDLAGNAMTHGLPEDCREWSLQPRGKATAGAAPVVWCEKCLAASPAASRICPVCGYDFGKRCDRCGQWRSARDWEYETHCGNAHDQVCDRCHNDAHLRAHLPAFTPPDIPTDTAQPEDKMPPANVSTPDDDLDHRLSDLLGELLAAERQAVDSAGVAQRDELRRQIARREAELADDNAQDALFDEFVDSPGNALPSSFAAQSRMFTEWENGRRAQLAEWRSQLKNLANRPVDQQLIFDRARRRVRQALNHAAQSADLLPDNSAGTTDAEPPATAEATDAPADSNPPADDRAALVALYNATDGANWTNSANWLSDAPLGEWYGVTTDAGGNVTRLRLTKNNLVGMIPAELSNLTNLEWLFLNDNQLTGKIPAELGNIANLQTLSLGENQLSGRIPAELGNLSNLGALILYKNQLTDEIPAELGSLANLGFLSLNGNQLTDEIPAELGSLANLLILSLHDNQLTGKIPTDLCNLYSLDGLYLSDNQLTGEIPAELGNLATLQQLHLSNNQLTGTIPAELGNLGNLAGLDIQGNQLMGEIPAELGNLDLVELLLNGNQLTGEIPTELGNLASLEGLDLHGNQLTGEIPTELGNLASLELLDLHGNQLTGEIPTELGNLTTLLRLYLEDNQLTGAIPAKLSNLTNLLWLSIGGNQLTGAIPAELGNFNGLQLLDLMHNSLTGEIPAELGNLDRLMALFLMDNSLTGEIPAELGNLDSLTHLHLSGNQFTGCIPAILADVAENDLADLGLPFCDS